MNLSAHACVCGRILIVQPNFATSNNPLILTFPKKSFKLNVHSV